MTSFNKCTHKAKHAPLNDAVPCFVEVLFKLGLVEKTIGIPEAYLVYLKIGSDPVVAAKVPCGFPARKVTAPYAATALKLAALTVEELKSLKLRIPEFR